MSGSVVPGLCDAPSDPHPPSTLWVQPEVSCGIGNSLFQMAMGLAYAKQTGRKVWIKRGNKGLSRGRPREYWDTVFHNVVHGVPALVTLVPANDNGESNMRVWRYDQPGWAYQPIPVITDSEVEMVILEGYFQSAVFFSSIEPEIVSLFSPPPHVLQRVTSLWTSFTREHGLDFARHSVISLHVRRGDYLLPCYHDFFTPFPTGFYREATRGFLGADKIQQPVFLIFSDDIEWCKKAPLVHDQEGGTVLYIPACFTDIDCLYTMMLFCDGGHIISNSTFAWWGAYLGFLYSGKKRRVVAPRPWFGSRGPSDAECDGMYPDGWTTVDRSRME